MKRVLKHFANKTFAGWVEGFALAVAFINAVIGQWDVAAVLIGVAIYIQLTEEGR